MNKHQKIYKLIALLLQYPEKKWLENIQMIEKEIESINVPLIKDCFHSFIAYFESIPYEELCERYVKTFDFHGITTLNLTYNVFKDSRERGNALIQLRGIFANSEFQPITDELPDYVPLILEFLSICEKELADQLIKIHYKSFEKLAQDLTEHHSPYQYLIKIVVYLASKRLKEIKAS